MEILRNLFASAPALRSRKAWIGKTDFRQGTCLNSDISGIQPTINGFCNRAAALITA